MKSSDIVLVIGCLIWALFVEYRLWEGEERMSSLADDIAKVAGALRDYAKGRLG